MFVAAKFQIEVGVSSEADGSRVANIEHVRYLHYVRLWYTVNKVILLKVKLSNIWLPEIPCKKKKVIVFQILRDGILVYVYFFIYYFIKQYNGSILILNIQNQFNCKCTDDHHNRLDSKKASHD